MTEIANILAEGGGKLINTIVAIGLIGVWIISQAFVRREREKTARQAEQERLRRDAEQAGGPSARQGDQQRTPQQSKPYPPMPTTTAQTFRHEPIRRQPIPVSPPPARPQAPVSVFPEPLRAQTAPAAPMPVFPEPLRPQAAPAPSQRSPAKSPARPKPRTVEDEITSLQSKLRKLEHLHVSNLDMAPSPEADTAAIESRLLSIRPAKTGAAVAGNSFITVNLSDPTNARTAIIMHEIFSPPKALRDEHELWDAC